MRLGEWLATREPAPPESLSGRLGALAADAPDDGRLVEPLLARGESLLARLVAGDVSSRDCAGDLLAVDALVTYAFEAAADEPDTLESRARAALARLAALGAGSAA